MCETELAGNLYFKYMASEMKLNLQKALLYFFDIFFLFIREQQVHNPDIK